MMMENLKVGNKFSLDKGKRHESVLFIILLYVTLFTSFTVRMILVYWTKYKITNDQHCLFNNENVKGCHAIVNSRELTSQTEVLREVIKTEKGYVLFMNHLGTEFSTECLLSTTEFVYFKKYIYDNNKDSIPGTYQDNFEDIPELPLDTIPVPSIILDNEDTTFKVNKQYRNKILKIYHKYIRVGSEYEINISYSDRKKFTQLFKDEQHWLDNESYKLMEIFTIFDGVIHQLMKLQNDSFRRFTNTDEYTNWKRDSINKNAKRISFK